MVSLSMTAALGSVLFALLAHPVHISSTQIDLARDGRSLEVSVRIFTDDFEEAIHGATQRRVRFGSTARPTLDSLANTYVSTRLKFSANGQTLQTKVIGHQQEHDAVLVFVEAPVNGVPKTLDVENVLLLELFSDQSNIVHARIGLQKRNALLRSGNERAHFDFP